MSLLQDAQQPDILEVLRPRGRREVWLATFPGFATGVNCRIGVVTSLERDDQRELCYLDLDGRMMSVALPQGPSAQPSSPTLLFETRVVVSGGFDQYDVTRDGERFLLLEVPQASEVPP